MNRYTAHGLAMEALEGKHVVICGDRQEICAALDDVVAFIPSDYVASVRRPHGAESIDFHLRGRISFAESPGDLRGRTADVVFIDHAAANGPLCRDWMEDASLTVVSRPNGSVVRA